MESVAESLVSQLTDMKNKFDELADKCDMDDRWDWTDEKSYQLFDKLTKDCVELFNEAERFLAQRHPHYMRKATLDKIDCKTPNDYAVRCEVLLLDVDDDKDSPVLPLLRNHPHGWRDIIVEVPRPNAYSCQI